MSLCEPWVTESDLTDCGCPDELLDGDVVADAITAASEWLDEKTDHRFGVCETTEYPCRGCTCSSPFACNCGSASSLVELRFGPVTNTPTVTIEGAAFTSFVVVAPNILRRTDGNAWPGFNNLDPTYGWSVTYQHGEPVPTLGKLAAADLAIEILKSCRGKACSLPSGAVAINRRGVSYQMDKAQTAAVLPRVGLFLDAYPGGQVRQVMRADRPMGYVTAGPA